MNNPLFSKLKIILPVIFVSFMIAGLVTAFLWKNIVITIRSGEAGVLYHRLGKGTDVDTIYPEGLTIILPWDIMYIYNTRIQQYTDNMSALTKEGLNVDLKISIRYYPELETVGMLQERVGLDYLNQLVIPVVEANIREQVGNLNITELYSPDPAIIQGMVNKTIARLERDFVNIQDVGILKITLPKVVQAAIERKLEYKVTYEGYKFRLDIEKAEAERKLLEADGIKVYNDTINKSLTSTILKWQGIQGTVAIASSNNAKVVMIGNNSKEMPIILGAEPPEQVVRMPKK